MNALLLLTISYVVGGLLLGLLMFLTAGHLQNLAQTTGTALTIKIGSYEINTSSVLVSLGIVAVGVMVGVPAYYLHLAMLDDHVITVQVKFQPVPPTAPSPKTIRVVRDDGGSFATAMLHVYRSGDKQAFTLTPDPYDSVPLIVWFDRKNGRPMASIRNGPDQAVTFDGESGSIGPIDLDQQTIPAKQPNVSSHPTSEKNVTPSLHGIPDPTAVQQTAAAQQG
jgi:hypothetical protein